VRQFGTLIGLVVLCAVLWILTPYFLTVSNLLNVAEQTSINAIVAVGMTFVILSAGIDLSVGSLVALSGVILGLALRDGQPLPLALVAALAVGIVSGAVNGLLISHGGLPPFIVTLGTMSIARGAALLVTEGRPISGFAASFRVLATGRVGFVPAPVIITAVVYLLAHVVLTRTTFGRYVYAIGGNPEAARRAGVRLPVIRTWSFALSGLISGIAGVLFASWQVSITTNIIKAANSYVLLAVAAAVIGGTSLFGGRGKTIHGVLGGLVIGAIYNGLYLLGVSSQWIDVAVAAVLIAAAIIDVLSRRGAPARA
jgi:ribose transport system permease protein